MSRPPKDHHIVKRIFFALKFLEIRLRFVFILIITALVVGYWDHIQNYYDRWQRNQAESQVAVHDHENEKEYYCPMHLFVVRDAPGKCPICGMDLSVRKKGEAQVLPEGVLTRVQVSPERVMQAGVQVEPVLYRILSRTVRSYGTIEAAEENVASIVARFPGRIEELMVDTAGVTVNKGEPLARIYSPKFLTAAQEYVRAIEAQKKSSTVSNPDVAKLEKSRNDQLVESARKRLELAGFTQEQLDALGHGGAIKDTVTLFSPLSGTVIEKNIVLGDTVEENTALYRIADLSKLWIQINVYEADIASVHKDMLVEISSVAYPGKIFYGTVDFVYPVVEMETRTVKVRVVVDNPAGLLKPGMYTTAVIRSPMGEYHEVSASEEQEEAVPACHAHAAASGPALPTTQLEDARDFIEKLEPGADYYECPMHPEVVSDEPGSCPLCKMDLDKRTKEAVPAGHAHSEVKAPLPTTTPADAQTYLDALAPGTEYYECPMHPEVVSDKSDSCPLCKMHLEKKQKPGPMPQDSGSTEEWAEGYACAMHLDELIQSPGDCTTCDCAMPMKKWRVQRVLSIPETAVIDTGERKIVYVESAPGVYDAKAVTLGLRAGDFYPVIDGLKLGEKIATRGSFLIDAEARLNPTTAVGAEPTAEPASPHAGHGM